MDCSYVRDGDRIDACMDDVAATRHWLDATAAAIRCAARLHRGLHVRARTLEGIQLDLEEAMETMFETILSPRWVTFRMSTGSTLRTGLQAQLGGAIHYLCLLRGRVSGGVIPSDIWYRVVLHLLPCIQDFRYMPASCARMYIKWGPIKNMPPEQPWLHEDARRASNILHPTDAARLFFLLDWCEAVGDDVLDSPHAVPTAEFTDGERAESKPCVRATVVTTHPSMRVGAPHAPSALLRLSIHYPEVPDISAPGAGGSASY